MLTSFVRRRRRRSSKRVSFKSIEIKEKILESGGESDPQEYLMNKNMSIMTDDEPDFYVSKPLVGMNSSDEARKILNEYANAEEKLVRTKNLSDEGILEESNDALENIMDGYVIVDIEEMTQIARNSSDNSDSESVKSMRDPLNCICNNTWYPQFKRYVLKNLGWVSLNFFFDYNYNIKQNFQFFFNAL